MTLLGETILGRPLNSEGEAAFRPAEPASGLSVDHPVLAVPGDDGGRRERPVGFRPISCRSAPPRRTLEAAGRLPI